MHVDKDQGLRSSNGVIITQMRARTALYNFLIDRAGNLSSRVKGGPRHHWASGGGRPVGFFGYASA